MTNLYLYFVIILISIFTYFLSTILYKKDKKAIFNILNHFPNELMSKWMLYIVALISIIFIIINGNEFLIKPTNHVNFFLSNIIGLLSIVTNVLLFTMFSIKFEKSFKFKIIISSSFIFSTLGLNSFGVLFILRSDIFSRLYILPFIIFMIIQIILIINCLIKGIDMVNIEEKEEGLTYTRKKVIPLAILEWGSVIIYFLIQLIFILIFIS